jgi:hypothetical protein
MAVRTSTGWIEPSNVLIWKLTPKHRAQDQATVQEITYMLQNAGAPTHFHQTITNRIVDMIDDAV